MEETSIPSLPRRATNPHPGSHLSSVLSSRPLPSAAAVMVVAEASIFAAVVGAVTACLPFRLLQARCDVTLRQSKATSVRVGGYADGGRWDFAKGELENIRDDEGEGRTWPGDGWDQPVSRHPKSNLGRPRYRRSLEGSERANYLASW